MVVFCCFTDWLCLMLPTTQQVCEHCRALLILTLGLTTFGTTAETTV